MQWFCCLAHFCPMLSTQALGLQVYIMTDRWFFKVMSRTELEEQTSNIRMSAQESTNLGDQAQASSKLKSEQPKAIGNVSLPVQRQSQTSYACAHIEFLTLGGFLPSTSIQLGYHLV